jgi:hypothetical protein
MLKKDRWVESDKKIYLGENCLAQSVAKQTSQAKMLGKLKLRWKCLLLLAQRRPDFGGETT